MQEANQIGNRIRNARKKARLSQRELAARVLRLNRTRLSQLETGQRSIASHELFGIAEALGTTTGNLLGMSETNPSLMVATRLKETIKIAIDAQSPRA